MAEARVLLGVPLGLGTALFACTPSPTDPPGLTGHSGLPGSTGGTGGTGVLLHTGRGASGSLVAGCEPTDNALRLACHVTVDPPQAVRIRYAPTDGSAAERVVTSDAVAAEHDLVLRLLPEDTDVAWTAEPLVPGPPGATGTTTTGHVPDEARAALVVTGTPGAPLLGSQQPCNTTATAVIFDATTGALVWYQGLDPAGALQPSDMVQFTEDHTVLGETGVSVVEVDLAGEELLHLRQGVDYTEQLHHDLFERHGHVYLLYQDPQSGRNGPVLDGFAVYDRTTATRVADWRAKQHLAVPPGATGDWMHTNTLSVDDADEVVLSSYQQNTVLAVAGDWTAPDFGEQRWALAGAPGGQLGSDFAVDWSGVAGDDRFARQHDAHFVDPDHLVLLDNPHGRGLVLSVDVASRRAVVERGDDTGASCGVQGTTARTATGDLLVGCAQDGALVDRDARGTQVWSARPVCANGASPMVARYYPLDGW